ncbi:unnamed protein product [Ixodes persulcatus]
MGLAAQPDLFGRPGPRECFVAVHHTPSKLNLCRIQNSEEMPTTKKDRIVGGGHDVSSVAPATQPPLSPAPSPSTSSPIKTTSHPMWLTVVRREGLAGTSGLCASTHPNSQMETAAAR